MHLYQQKLDSLQETAPAATIAATQSSGAAASCEDSEAAAAAADVVAELSRLEQELEAEDILLCRSLAELALDRRSTASSGKEITT